MKNMLKDKFIITFVVMVLGAVYISSSLEVKMVKENKTETNSDFVYNMEK
ncbi:MAG TPA: hypothetical protein GX747_00505 [Tenericutes bacterium]|nr:hypothetical protein [Mycoplasmatota bacterium]